MRIGFLQTKNISVDKISNLTYKVVAFSEVPEFNMDDAVDWAVEMISLGYESPSLFILAGISKPTNYFEVVDYLKETLEELHLQVKTGDDAVFSYSSYYLEQIANGKNVRRNLERVYEFCQLKDYEKQIYDFKLLYWAWGDLDYGNNFTDYWPKATKENIEKILMSTAVKWVKENRKHYCQTI